MTAGKPAAEDAMNLFELMRAAGGGNAFSALAAQYGLSEDQVARAMQAFLPALSAGVQRSTDDPLGFLEFMRRLASGNYLKAYQNPGWAAATGRRQGEDALAFLFGSPEAARMLAGPAAAFTGLTQEKLAELLPPMAAMMFGGLAQQSAASNPFVEAMLKAFGADEPERRAAKGPLDRYEEQQAERQRAAAGDLGRAQGETMRSGLAAFQAGTEAWEKAVAEMTSTMRGVAPAGNADKAVAPTGRDVFGEMLEPGLRLGEAYQREMEAMLERLKPEKKG